jgi:hypothetical protein
MGRKRADAADGSGGVPGHSHIDGGGGKKASAARGSYIDMPIEELELSERTYFRLKRLGCDTVWDALEFTHWPAAHKSGFGKQCFNELVAKLGPYAERDPELADLVGAANRVRALPDSIKGREAALHRLIGEVSPALAIAPFEPLAMAYTDDDKERKALLDILRPAENITQLGELVWRIAPIDKAHRHVADFLAFLRNDSRAVFAGIMSVVFANDSQRTILAGRASGETLEEAGGRIGVTRERARQIEKMVQVAFDLANTKRKPMWLLCAELGGSLVIPAAAIDGISDNPAVLRYLLANTRKGYHSYNDDVRVFLLGEDNSALVREALAHLPSKFLATDVDAVVASIAETARAQVELVRLMFDKEFKPNGVFNTKKRIGLSGMYEYVLRQYYPRGIKIGNKRELKRFKEYITASFDDPQIPPSDRAIEARVAAISVLCDRGAYIHKSYVKIPAKLVAKLDEYVRRSHRTAISFPELFEAFKDELLKTSNIHNRYFLQGVLKLKLGDKYRFTRDYISKAEGTTIDKEIVDFITERGEVTKSELRAAFNGLTEAMLVQIVSRAPEILAIDFSIYAHADRLDIRDEDYAIADLLRRETKDMPASARRLFEQMPADYADFFERNSINTHTKLFAILRYMFGGEFVFSRPYIAMRGSEDVGAVAIFKDRFGDSGSVPISELVAFCADQRLRYTSVAGLLRDLDDVFLRSGADSLVNITRLNLSDANLGMIRRLLYDDTALKGYLSAAKKESFDAYPDMGAEWNGWLLLSIVKKYLPDFNVLEFQMTHNSVLNAVFLHPSIDVDGYEEFLRWVIKEEHGRNAFRDLAEIRKWLVFEGLINAQLPGFLSTYVYRDSGGKVIVR